MNHKLKTFARDIFSWPIFQKPFEILLNFSLKGMNIGEGQAVETSGENNVPKLLEKIVKDKKEVTVFDVGAHTGEWLNMFKKFYTKKAIVYSFEPEKSAFLELSKLAIDNFHPVNCALGEVAGTKYLSAAQVSDVKNDASEEIKITTLDAYCREHAIHHIDLLKIDIEGYELKMLRGAKEMIANGNIDLIQFEFGAPSEEKYSMQDFFGILGPQYVICRILKHGCFPLPEYKHYYEILTVTNFVAIKKECYSK